MIWSVGLLIAQFVAAYLALDLVFRVIDLSPVGFAERLRRYGLGYAVAAGVFAVVAGWAQWLLGGRWGLALAAANWAPWGVLWRFGLRKQLTFLFKDDGGRSLDSKKPDL